MNSEAILLMLADLLIKGAAIFTVAFTAQHFMRRSSAARIHLVWLAAFTALLLLPLTKLMQPRWSFAIEQPTVTVAAPRMLPPIQQASLDEVSTVALPESKHALRLPTASQFILSVWLIGLGLLLSRRLVGCWQLSRMKRQSTKVQSAQVVTLAERLCRDMGITQRIDLRQSSMVAVPLTWGLTRSVLMLPTVALEWSEERLGAALRHEVGHIQRRDVLSRWLADIVCAVHWMNPLAWFAARAMRTVQERACDDLVLNAGCSSADYAVQLLDTTRSIQTSFTMLPALAMAQPSTLETRLVAIVDAQCDRRAAGLGAMMTGATMTGLALLLCANAQLGAADKPKTDDAANPSPQILVSTKVIEAPVGLSRGILGGVAPVPGVTVLMSEAQSVDFLKKLQNIKGVDILSAPRVTTISGRLATIEVGRELALDETAKKTTFIGVKVELLPTLNNEVIELQAKPMVREIERYETVGGTKRPIIRERKVDTTVKMEPGQTVVLSAGADEQGDKKRELLFLISAEVLKAKSSGTTPAPKQATSPLEERAAKIVLEKVEFENATIEQALEFLRSKSLQLDPEKKGINILLKKPASGELPKLTLSLTNIPLPEVLRYVATLTNLELTAESAAYLLQPMKDGTATKPAPPAAGKSTAAKKASEIIIPVLETNDATVAEVVEFLRLRAQALDPSKVGVNLILKEDGDAQSAKITLSLKEIPLSEALKYVAQLAGLEIEATEFAIILKSREKK